MVHWWTPQSKWKFAAVAGYHASSDSILLLDADRASSPCWVPLNMLWCRMCLTSEGGQGGYIAVGSMATNGTLPSAHHTAACPRIVRSWGEGKLVVEPVLKATRVTMADMCPLGVWAATSCVVGNKAARRTLRTSRHAMRMGSASKSRPRASSTRGADEGKDEALALAGLLLQSWPLAPTGPQGRAMAVGVGRSVHSSPVATVVEDVSAAGPCVNE